MAPSIHIPGYRIEREVGRGGMAVVYLASQESLNRPVALKVMAPVLATDDQFAKRFYKEGVTVARLSHPGIIKVFDTGVFENNYYLSMEYLPGGTLADRINEGLPLDQGLWILRRVADALGHAHRHNVVHRDIKPQNILFYSDGSPCITDFGIAKTFGAANTVMTATGMMVGSPSYMSPEQIQGQPVDAKSDLYGLGVVFYEILTGKAPYAATDSFALAFQHLHNPVPQLPDDLAVFQPILDRILAKSPQDRFDSAEAFIAALDRVTGRDTISTATRPFPAAVAKTPTPSRRTGLWTALAAVLALAVTAGAWYYIGTDAGNTGPLMAPATVDPHQDPRLRQATDYLDEARQLLSEDAPNAALTVLEKVLALDPDSAAGRDLRDRAQARIAQQQQQAEQERRRQAELEQRQEAQRQAALEQQQEAQRQAALEQQQAAQRLAKLEHQEADRLRRAEQEWQRIQDERRRLEAEKQRLETERRQHRIATHLTIARRLLAQDQVWEALTEIDQALTLDPDATEALALRATAQATLEEQQRREAQRQAELQRRQAEAEARRQAELQRQLEQEARRRTTVEQSLSAARRARAQGDLSAGLAYLDRGLSQVPGEPELLTLRRAIQDELAGAEDTLSREQRRKMQLALSLLGYDTQGIDGLFGGNTRRAVQAFQTANGFTETGYLTRAQIKELLGVADEAMVLAGVSEVPDSVALLNQPAPDPTPAPKPAATPKPAPAPEATATPEPQAPIAGGTGNDATSDGGGGGGIRRRVVRQEIIELEAPPPKLVEKPQPLVAASANTPLTAAELRSMSSCWARKGGSLPKASIVCVENGGVRVRVDGFSGVCQAFGQATVNGLGLSIGARRSEASRCPLDSVRLSCDNIRRVTMQCSVDLRFTDSTPPRQGSAQYIRAVTASAR